MTTPQPQTPQAARERLAAAMAKGGEHIGDLAWPELRVGGHDIEREQLRRWLDEEGLPESWGPADPSGQKSFGKALSKVTNLEAAPGVTIEREELRSRVALIRYSTGKGLEKRTVTWARVWVNDLDEIEIEWSQDRVVQDALSGAMSSTVLAHVCIAHEALQVEFDRLQRFMDAAELGETVIRVMVEGLGAIRVRRDGGLYFVPSTMADELRSFARVITKTGDSALPFIPAFDTPEGRQNLGRSINDTLQAEIDAVVKGLAKLGGAARGPRESSLARRLEELDALSTRAASCRIVLQSYAEDIALSVKAAKAQVLEMMELRQGGEEGEEG